MDNKRIIKFVLILSVISIFGLNFQAYAQGEDTSSPDAASFKSICDKVDDDTDKTYGKYPSCANSPSKCGSTEETAGEPLTPLNCLFLEEPIGGEPGYDLYKITCTPTTKPKDKPTGNEAAPGSLICRYELWDGGAIIGANKRGPVQAVLAYEKGKEYQGPLGLLYNYLGLIYKFMSGVIVGFVVLISIIGGIKMTISAGNQQEFGKGRQMIQKAIIGMALWFLASLILYTINPTFFAF